MENLRYVLAPYDPDFPIALGERFIENGNRDRSYLGGGSGYVLSRGALRVYGEVAYENETLCQKEPIGPEDVTLGVCMTSSGILLGDTRDQFGKHRFHQNIPRDYIEGKWQSWYPNVTLYGSGKGIESLSETSISFHNLKSDSDLYVLEYFIYILKLFNVEGRFTGPSVAPLPPDVDSAPEEARRRFIRRKRKIGTS
ncbi:glycoprotein-N-acetylgalactosamine 3-beta-galactosyltransferase 1-like [Macrobrachium nipponense]|uniref:glycoprotein-N-acetylgalactosamine 3-beta-galactosyltransferase 1-like n=1 Tax=Macrobrachium nipponense TaxID=159736 RepID=UPI0030C8D32E